MFQGQTLDAVFADALEHTNKTTEDDMIAAYVAMPRVTCVLQPFSKWLFDRGPPVGPHVLMRKLRGGLSEDEAKAEYDMMYEQQRAGRKAADPMEQLYARTRCYLLGEDDYMKPVQDFGVRRPSELLTNILAHGAWARCTACNERRRQQLAAAKGAGHGVKGAVRGVKGNHYAMLNQARSTARRERSTA